MPELKFRMRVIRGAFLDPSELDRLGAQTIEKLERDVWISIDQIVATIPDIERLQKQMIKHYDDWTVPWYMDGINEADSNDVLVAFGADDGSGGKLFRFRRNDQSAIDEVIRYGISKGIPKEQMDFLET